MQYWKFLRKEKMKKVIYKVVRNEIIDRKVASVIQKFIYETYIPTSTFKGNKMMKVEISGVAIGDSVLK